MATTLARIEAQARKHLKEEPALSTPSAPTVSPQGTTGATAYSYKVVAGHRHGETAASSAGSTATGNATLSSSNFNRITWTAVTGASYYSIYRTVGGATTGLIGIVGEVLQFDDTGLTGGSETAPTVSTAGGQFWSSDELIDIINQGIKDLWGMVVDLNQEHYMTVDITNVSLAANATQLTGVPSDCFRVLSIEPLTTTTTPGMGIVFRPKDDNSFEMQAARSRTALETQAGLVIYYTLTQPGPPIDAPTVLTAPKITSELDLRFAYVPTLAAKTASDNNPIPGESDNALIAWCVAYARAKEREDRSPDPNWLAIYGTEKTNLNVRLTPRQTHEPEVVDDFMGEWGM